jgi:hypothetical protein
MLTGGCFCGRVRYEARGPAFNRTSCHCSICRRTSCGTQLAFELDGARDEIDVTTCSLDDTNRLVPTDHTRVSSKLEWVKLADGLPQFRESREEG